MSFYERYNFCSANGATFTSGAIYNCDTSKADSCVTAGKQADRLFLIHRGTVADHTVSFVTTPLSLDFSDLPCLTVTFFTHCHCLNRQGPGDYVE